MITIIDTLEQRDQDLQRNAEHYKSLLRALAPDPASWKFTGDILEGDPNESRCACGHPIKWLFVIERNGQTKHLGSTCINHFEFINQETFTALCQAQTALSARLTEAEHKAKRAAQSVEASEAQSEFVSAYDKALALYDNYRSVGQQAPRKLWEAVASRAWSVPSAAPDYQRASDLIKWYRKHIEILQLAIL